MDCTNCPRRKYYAKVYDMHWLDEKDCPFNCEKEEEPDQK